jgi:hypothetical protein
VRARRGAVGVDEPPDPFVSTRDAGNHQVVHHQRRAGRTVVLTEVGHLDVPEKRPRGAIERDQVRVVRDHEHPVVEHRHTAVDPAGGIAGQTLRAWTAVMPDFASGRGIEAVRFIHRGDVHGAVDHDGRDLERARSPLNREHPLGREALDVAGVDLIERAEPIAALVSIVGRPRARFRLGDICERNPRGLGARSGSEQTDADNRANGQHTDPYHRCSRRLVTCIR